MPERQFRMIINVLQIQVLSEEEILFNQGDEGRFFYIVLSGRIGIFVRRQLQRQANKLLKTEIEDVSYTFKKKDSERKLAYFKLVNQVTQGNAFGELALSTDTSVRAATAVALQTTVLAYMDKEDYLKILQVIERERLEKRVQFLRSLSIFKNWTNSKLALYIHYTFITEYKLH